MHTQPDLPTHAQRLAATLVHTWTAFGTVLALLMVHYAYQAEVEIVLWLFLAAMVIDGTDGMLARWLRVKEVLPGFDGALLDNIVDFITYVFAPMVLLWSCGYLPDGWLGGLSAAVPLMASCYQFCRTDAKTDDHFFLGFPSYWNIVAFYVVVLELSTTTTAVLLGVLAVLVFVPIKYVYPSRTPFLWAVNMTLATLWLGLYGVVVAALPDPSAWLIGLSLVYVAYYVVASLWLTARTARRTHVERSAEAREVAPV
ncbi:CDP-alcohol phosphatidyltransferase family protein [Nocardioides campestrisoli]|uniref:CDP-alcohol phosphatidyltransferase family protein n=1 Tax=Nocardioides campestrisoli TaxID=2736757 RepID=UPI0015E6445E|nr:CDP-alcohol phosphatidyltransferase family protein [Nocardioides campestrisoli]